MDMPKAPARTMALTSVNVDDLTTPQADGSRLIFYWEQFAGDLGYDTDDFEVIWNAVADAYALPLDQQHAALVAVIDSLAPNARLHRQLASAR